MMMMMTLRSLLLGRQTSRIGALALALLLELCGSAVLAAETPQGTGAPASCATVCTLGQVAVADTREVFTAPVRWQKPQWKSAAIKAAIVVGAVALLDQPVRDYMLDHKTDTTDNIADAFEPFGAEYAAGVLAGYALVGVLADKPVARRIALDGVMSGLITSVLFVPALKEIAGRSRPHTDLGKSDFNPFSGSASFPSGHTAAAFTIAATIAENSDQRWVKGLSYGIASLVGYARLEHDDHWLSDVTAGAFIGIGVAKTVARVDRERRGITLAPVHSADAWGIQLSKAF